MNVMIKNNLIVIDGGISSADSYNIHKFEELLEIIKKDYEICIIISDIDEVKKRENAEENKLIEERKKRKEQDDIIIKELLTVNNLLQHKIGTIPDTKEGVITKKLLSEKLDNVRDTHQNYINSY